MMDRKKYIPVRCISFKGRLLVSFIRLLFHIRRLLGGKDWVGGKPGHHEDPKFMKPAELLHLAHKYYFRTIAHAGNEGNFQTYFRENAGEPDIPAGFEPESSITLSAAGDLMPYASINKDSCGSLWDECGEFFFGADLVTANLETPVASGYKPSMVPEVMLRNMYFNADNQLFDIFSGNGKYQGYQVLSVANNHALDQGTDGLLQTLSFLKEKNIYTCGASGRQESGESVAIVEKYGIRIAFLGATYSLNARTLPHGKEWMINHLSLNRPNPDISLLINEAKMARQQGADLLVAHLHMGLAYQPYPSLQTMQTMHEICHRTGIDILLGGHPHNPQPFEFFSYPDPFTGKQKKSFIIYSMGDFIAYDIFKWCHLPLMIKFRISKGKPGTFITGIEMKLGYMLAFMRNGRLERLMMRDFRKVLTDESSLDEVSRKEFSELKSFAKRYLLPGNVEKFLV